MEEEEDRRPLPLASLWNRPPPPAPPPLKLLASAEEASTSAETAKPIASNVAIFFIVSFVILQEWILNSNPKDLIFMWKEEDPREKKIGHACDRARFMLEGL